LKNIKVPVKHLFECFERQVKKEFQPELDPLSEVISFSREGNINVISNFSFEKTSIDAEVLF